MKTANLPRRILTYLLGLFIMTLGIAFAIKSNLGAAPVSSIPYTLNLCFGVGIDVGTILFHTFLVLLQILILRKNFKWINLLQVAAGVIFGYFTRFCCSLVGGVVVENLAVRLVMILFSAFLIALGIFFYIPADVIPLAAEGLNKTISEKTGVAFNKVKIAFDVTVVALSLIVPFFVYGFKDGFSMLLRGESSVGIGTVIDAVLVGVILGFLNRRFKFIVDKMLGA